MLRRQKGAGRDAKKTRRAKAHAAEKKRDSWFGDNRRNSAKSSNPGSPRAGDEQAAVVDQQLLWADGLPGEEEQSPGGWHAGAEPRRLFNFGTQAAGGGGGSEWFGGQRKRRLSWGAAAAEHLDGGRRRDEEGRLDRLLEEQEAQEAFAGKFLAVWNDGEGPEARLKRLSLMLRGFSAAQLILCSCLFIFAGVSSRDDPSGEGVFEDIFCGIVGFLSALLGLIASRDPPSEFLARFFFVCQMWMLNSLTLYLYVGVDHEQKQNGLCSPSTGSQLGDSGECQARLANHQAKVSFAVIGAVISVTTAAIALDFNDAINDYGALRPMLYHHEKARQKLNLNHPNYLVHTRPRDKHAKPDWHLKHARPRGAPDVEGNFADKSR